MQSHVRWWICGLLFLATTVNYMDRQVIGCVLQFTGSYLSLFAIAAGSYLLALLMIQILAPKLQPVQIRVGRQP